LLGAPCLHFVSTKWVRWRQKGRQRERQRGMQQGGRVRPRRGFKEKMIQAHAGEEGGRREREHAPLVNMQA